MKNPSTNRTKARRAVVENAMEQFRRFRKQYGSTRRMLNATNTGDKLILACAALDKLEKK